jgi:hypothetical protein
VLRERTVNKLTTAITRDENGLIIGSDAKIIQFLNPATSDVTQTNIPGVEDPSSRCIVSASSLHGEMSPFELIDLVQFLINQYPREVREAIVLTQAQMKPYGVTVKTG